MGKSLHGIQNHRTYGDAILARLKDGPAALKKPGAVFASAQKAFATADDAASAAKEKRDAAIHAIGEADAELDTSVEALASALVAAGAKRTRPFEGLSAHAPSDLCGLAYATEVTEVNALVTKVLAKKPAAPLKKACDACTKNAKAVRVALAALTPPQNAYAKALAARDALLPSWEKSLRTLKKHASLAFDDAEGDYDALFAPPEAVQAPVKKRAKKSPAKKSPAKKAAPPAPPAPAKPSSPPSSPPSAPGTSPT